MPTKTLDPEALAVDTFATTPRMDVAAVVEHAKASGATSCVNRPPYCTC